MAAMQILDALDRFLLQLQADGRSPHTLCQYRRHLRLLASWLTQRGHVCDVGEVDDQDLARFLTSPVATIRADGEPKKAGSTNALRTSIRCFFGYLERGDLINQNPARLIRLAITSPPPPRELRPHEEKKLRAVFDAALGPQAERDRVLFEVMLGTGIRLSSALALDVEDLDLEDAVAHVRRLKRGGELRVFLPDRLRDMLTEFLGDRRCGAVFCSAAGRRTGSRQAQRRFRRWAAQAGISASVSPHALRHAFAMRLYARTRDLPIVQRALGHGSVTSTLVYASASDADQRWATTNQVRG